MSGGSGGSGSSGGYSGASAAASGTATVTDAALSVSGAGINATEGAAFNGTVASLTDPNPNDSGGDYTATVAWGDGSSSGGSLSGSNGSFTISGGHTYAEEGS